MKGIILFLAVLIFSPLAPAKAIKPCKQVKGECVGIVIEPDGYLWIAKRVVTGNVITWEPIKKADCPAVTASHEIVAYGHDAIYGDYECVYEEDTKPVARGVGGYIKTHKVLLITDALLVTASMADAASAVHCQHVSPQCKEGNFLLPKRPSNVQLYGFATATSLGTVAFDHWIKHGLSNSDFGMLYLFDVAPALSGYAHGTSGNIGAAEYLQQQKARSEFLRRF